MHILESEINIIQLFVHYHNSFLIRVSSGFDVIYKWKMRNASVYVLVISVKG